jgi:hypothetical protein
MPPPPPISCNYTAKVRELFNCFDIIAVYLQLILDDPNLPSTKQENLLLDCDFRCDLLTVLKTNTDTATKAGLIFTLRPVKWRVRHEAPNFGPRGYDNVLFGQGYRSPSGAVTNEYEAVLEMIKSSIKWKTRRKFCSRATNFTWHHPGFEPGLRGEMPASTRLSY